MKRAWIQLAVVIVGIGSARASWDPGATAQGLPAPPAFLPRPSTASTAPGGDGTLTARAESPLQAFPTPLRFSVVEGDVVLLVSETGGTSSDHWSDAVRWEDVGGKKTAAGFPLRDCQGLGPGSNVRYLSEGTGGAAVKYYPEGRGTHAIPQGAGAVVAGTYAYLAAVLLLLPFALSTLRIAKRRTAGD